MSPFIIYNFLFSTLERWGKTFANCNYYSLVMSYRKILILCTAVCHFDRSERFAKVLISYNITLICFG